MPSSLVSRSTSDRSRFLTEIDSVGDYEVRLANMDVEWREAVLERCLLRGEHQRQRGNLNRPRIDVDAEEVVLQDRRRDFAWFPSRRAR